MSTSYVFIFTVKYFVEKRKKMIKMTPGDPVDLLIYS